jgi:hypothetical protein
LPLVVKTNHDSDVEMSSTPFNGMTVPKCEFGTVVVVAFVIPHDAMALDGVASRRGNRR